MDRLYSRFIIDFVNWSESNRR